LDTVLRQLAVCEASDWFWWLGSDNQLQDGPDFDRLFRQQLADLYDLIGSMPPPGLQVPINEAASGMPGKDGHAAGAMRPAGP